jgi:hypothetical protein
MRARLILGAMIGIPAAAFAAAQPAALSKVAGGLWEISGAPGTQGPVRQCVSDVLSLAQYEHRGKPCTRSVISDGPRSTTIDYKCGAAGFGQTDIEVVTPRALTISTQGISDQLPFNYVLLARRVGDCEKGAAVIRH